MSRTVEPNQGEVAIPRTSKHKRRRPASLETYYPGASVSVEEIHQILADEGYSVGERRGWLKTLLTDISSEDSHVPQGNKEELIKVVKEIIEAKQNGESIAKDTL